MNSPILLATIFYVIIFSAKFDMDVACIPGNLHQNTCQSSDHAKCYGKHRAVMAQKGWDKTMKENGKIFQLYQLVREFKIPFGGEWLVCMEQA